MAKKWQVSSAQPSEELRKYVKSELLAKLLASRNVLTPKDADEFLNPLNASISNHSVFTDMPKAVSRLKKAVEDKEHILIWGDFDADGVTSSALLHKTFSKLGAEFSHFIPEREAHGHGLNSQVLVKLVSQKKVKVVVTVDCAISDIKQIAMLKGLKVDVILTDHHKAPDVLPEAYAIINPRAQGSLSDDLSVGQISSLCDLAGVGVAHKLALALLEGFKISDQKLEDELMALVAIGSISDVVPLLGENRALVAKGLKCINEGALKGADMLFKSAGKENEITSTDVAFVLTPRINAVGRLSKADEAFNLLTETSGAKLNISIEYLTNNNKIRQGLCDDIYQQALDMLSKNPTLAQEKAIVLFNPEWHLGIIGIVASRLVDTFNKPAFLMTLDSEGVGRCSARGVLGYSIYDAMSENETLFLGFGGHTLAGGMSFEPKEHSPDEIRAALLKTFSEYEDTEVGNVLEIDACLNAGDINKELLEVIASLEPCGQKNPSPVFCINDATLLSYSFVGKEGSHLKYACKKDDVTLSCVWWSQGEFNVPHNSLLNVAFTPRLNVFNGTETIQLETCAVESEYLKEKTFSAQPSVLKFYDHRFKVLEDILPQVGEYLLNPSLSLGVVARKSLTLAALEGFESILKRTSFEAAEALMFFDYPASAEELSALMLKSGAKKVHLMREVFEEDIEHYLKKLSGMVKYVANKKDGVLELSKIVFELGLSEEFVKLALKIFEELEAIQMQSSNKVLYLKPATVEELQKSALWGALLEEFDKSIEFKTALVSSDEFEELFNEALGLKCPQSAVCSCL